MKWTHHKKILIENELLKGGLNSDFYKDYRFIFGNVLEFNSCSELDPGQDAQLCCLNLKTNSWSTFATQRIGFSSPARIFNLLVYKNMLVVCGKDKGQLSIAMLDLDSKELSCSWLKHLEIESLNLKSPEEEHIASLFLSDKESDIVFKVQDKILPAHKQVLMQKSRYFANLFNSGMIESRQEVIGIQDGDYDVFQGSLVILVQII